MSVLYVAKSKKTQEVTTEMLIAREIYRKCGLATGICIVLPEEKSIQDITGDYFKSVESRIDRDDVLVVSISEIDKISLEGYSHILDFS